MDRHAGAVEPDEYWFGLDALHAQAHERGKSRHRCGWTHHLGALDRQGAPYDVGDLPAGRGRLLVEGTAALVGQRRRRRTEGQQRGDRLEPAPAPPLLCATDQEWLEPGTSPHDERAGSGNATELVRADAHQVRIEGAQVGGDVPARGGGVDVDGHAGVAAQRHHLVDRLEGAHLVVGPLAMHEGRPRQTRRMEAGAQRVDVEPAGGVHAECLDRRRARRGVTNGRVLDGRAEHRRPGVGAAGAPHRGVDRLGARRR